MWASAPTNISKIRFGRTESSAPTKIYKRTQKRKYSAPPANAQVACCFHGRVLCHLPAWQLVPMGALSPRRRRCSYRFVGRFPCAGRSVLLRGHSVALRYNPIRFQRLFLPTFSGKTEKVGLRSNGYSVSVNNGTPVPTGGVYITFWHMDRIINRQSAAASSETRLRMRSLISILL